MTFIFRKNKLNELKDISDEDLFKKFWKTGNQKLVAELFQRYTHLVFGICYKYLRDTADAEDAVMQLFEQLLTKEPTSEISNFSGWLYTVSKNHCLMKLRVKKPFQTINNEKFQLIENDIMELPDILHHYDNEEREIHIKKIKSAIEQLKDEQKKCIELFYLENKVYKQIAEETGYDIKAVKSHIQNGKRNLKILLGNERDQK